MADRIESEPHATRVIADFINALATEIRRTAKPDPVITPETVIPWLEGHVTIDHLVMGERKAEACAEQYEARADNLAKDLIEANKWIVKAQARAEKTEAERDAAFQEGRTGAEGAAVEAMNRIQEVFDAHCRAINRSEGRDADAVGRIPASWQPIGVILYKWRSGKLLQEPNRDFMSEYARLTEQLQDRKGTIVAENRQLRAERDAAQARVRELTERLALIEAELGISRG
ncbi:hypothetical protein [Mesoterricola sediminis]|uniref:Uncharacterized protein n=1 Tax=Mesoterricola sediminis TaxID=2927980 RepID=A0AA48H2G1_9BACT|nr:hypothetical protein [Mesoterricola sediminis]BDU76246.1 hypothetical protein METESE_12040 [Mesoterricola sediminis]